eukprot:267037-Prorocentrum_minimum.AAC.1
MLNLGGMFKSFRVRECSGRGSLSHRPGLVIELVLGDVLDVRPELFRELARLSDGHLVLAVRGIEPVLKPCEPPQGTFLNPSIPYYIGVQVSTRELDTSKRHRVLD